jgi:hypothetical protein
MNNPGYKNKEEIIILMNGAIEGYVLVHPINSCSWVPDTVACPSDSFSTSAYHSRAA